MLEKVYDFVTSRHLIEPGDSVLIALSGGKDSVFCTLILQRLKQQLGINHLACLHVNHRLRGDDSTRDELFCREFSISRGVPFYCERVNVKLLSLMWKRSLEDTGREVRYKILEHYARVHGYNKIVTAHTKDDQIETLLMRLVKGTGLDGFAGIHEQRGYVIRPLLTITADEIRAYLTDSHIEFTEDSTNSVNTFDRNKIRNEIIPIFTQINPRFDDALLRFHSIVKNAHSLISEQVSKAIEEHLYVVKGGYVLELASIEALLLPDIIEYITKTYYKITLSFDKTAAIIELILGKNSGKFIMVSDFLEVHYNFEQLYFIQEEDFFIEDQFPLVSGEHFIEKYKTTLTVRDFDNDLPVFIDENECYIPTTLIDLPTLCARTRTPGDVFISMRSMKRRKLKKFFNDIRIPRVLRDKVLLIADKERIYSIVGIDKSAYTDVPFKRPYIHVRYTVHTEMQTKEKE